MTDFVIAERAKSFSKLRQLYSKGISHYRFTMDIGDSIGDLIALAIPTGMAKAGIGMFCALVLIRLSGYKGMFGY